MDESAMATVAITWELGSDLGHISRFLPIAQKLERNGHHPILILRDLSRVNEVFKIDDIDCIQAPTLHENQSNLTTPRNFTETLLNIGYKNKTHLAMTLTQWVEIYQAIKPDILIFDHSPTAMLASRNLNCPKIQIGNSFTVLPHNSPLPSYKFWDTRSEALNQLHALENQCVANINHALDAIEAPKIETLHQLYETDHTFIDTHPLLDVYGERKNAEYLGVFKRTDIGVSPLWPSTHKPKIFMYLKSHYPYIEELLEACHNSDAQFLIYGVGISEELTQKFASSEMIFSDHPYKVSEIIQSCDCSINHSGSIADPLLQYGKPQLLLPMQMEQMMRAKKITATDAALLLSPSDSNKKLQQLISRLLEDTNLQQAAQLIASALLDKTGESDIRKVCRKVDDLLSPR